MDKQVGGIALFCTLTPLPAVWGLFLQNQKNSHTAKLNPGATSIKDSLV